MPFRKTTATSRQWQRAEVRRLLVAALKDADFAAGLEPPELDLLLRLLRRVRLHARLAADLKCAGHFDELPEAAKDQLESILVVAESRSRLALWELDRIHWATQSGNDIRLVCMKGCTYLLLRTRNAVGRIFADVDLLVDEQHLGAVEKILNEKGWKTRTLTPYDDNYYRRWTHELPPLVHDEREVEIDLHRSVYPRTGRLRPPVGDMLDAAVRVEGSPYLVLSDADTVLHAMVHLTYDSDMADKLRDLVDIGDLLMHFSAADSGFWARLTARAEHLGLTRPAFYGIRFAAQCLQYDIPQNVLGQIQAWSPPAPVRFLMDTLADRALFPSHPDDERDMGARIARLLLYIRSHWVRMPPWLLAYHLSYKFVARRIGAARKSDS